jgi:hypothetical protein
MFPDVMFMPHRSPENAVRVYAPALRRLKAFSCETPRSCLSKLLDH